MKIAARRQKNYYDSRICGSQYAVGDLVWSMNRMSRKEISPKLQARWLGPGVVMEKINDVTCMFQAPRDEAMILHFGLLKPFCGEEVSLLVRTRVVEPTGSSTAERCTAQ